MIFSHCDVWRRFYSLERLGYHGVGLDVASCTGGFQLNSLSCSVRRLWHHCSDRDILMLASILYADFHGTARSQKCVKYLEPRIWNFILAKMNPNCSSKGTPRNLLMQCFVSDLTS